MSKSDFRNILIILLVLILLFTFVPILYMLVFSQQNGFHMGMGMMSNMGIHMFAMFIPFWVFLLGFIIALIGLVYVVGQQSSPSIYREEMSSEKYEREEGSIEDILKVLRDDERRVVELLINKGGKILQKDIRWELNMSRLQVHRVLERLEERNIVVRRPVGNTNEVRLSDWLMDKIK